MGSAARLLPDERQGRCRRRDQPGPDPRAPAPARRSAPPRRAPTPTCSPRPLEDDPAFGLGRNPMPREAGQQNPRAAHAARLPQYYDHLFDTVQVRTAYRCRAYPDEQQQQVLARTFGCVRVVWNRTLAGRCARWQTNRLSTSYAQADAALTAMKKDPDLAF